MKWAQTSDAFVARKNYDSKWISNSKSRQLVHQWRADEDAILVGTHTAKYDDPELNVRGVEGTNPLRIVIDRKLKLNTSLKLFDHTQPTIVYNLKQNKEEKNLCYMRLNENDFLKQLLADLHQRKIQSLIIEGGASTLNAFIEADLWDEARIFTANTQFGGGILAPSLNARMTEERDIVGDKLEVFINGH